MKSKFYKLFLSLLFLLTLCGYAFGDISGVVIVGPTNLTEFNYSSGDYMNVTFWGNFTNANTNNCSLLYIEMDGTINHAGSINVPNITDDADTGTLVMGNFSGIAPDAGLVTVKPYESFILQIVCNFSTTDATVGNPWADNFNITSENLTYEFNGQPTNLSVTVNLDSTLKGQDKTFAVSWDDQNGSLEGYGGPIRGDDVNKVYVCSSDEFTYAGGCSDTTYSSSTGNRNSSSETYTVSMSLGGGAHDAYVYVTDDGGLTSGFYYLTFATSSGGITREEMEKTYAERRGVAPMAVAGAVEEEEPGKVGRFFKYQILKIVPVWIALIMVCAFIFFWKTTKKK